jgi:heme oxygenase (biliverdin-IX-beta and delta-forming)
MLPIGQKEPIAGAGVLIDPRPKPQPDFPAKDQGLRMPEVAIPTTTPVKARTRSAQAPGVRGLLKQATAAAHARLDEALTADDLLTLPGYRRFLESNAAAVLPLEQALCRAGVARILPDWEQRSCGAAIIADIAVVGGSVREPPPVHLAGDDAVLGTLYVLEGSRLGARYLLRHVEASLDPLVRQATGYLSHGAGKQFWPSFVKILELRGHSVDTTAMVMAARRAFALFHDAAVAR